MMRAIPCPGASQGVSTCGNPSWAHSTLRPCSLAGLVMPQAVLTRRGLTVKTSVAEATRPEPRYSQDPWQQGTVCFLHTELLIYGKAARSLGVQLGYEAEIRKTHSHLADQAISKTATERAQEVINDFFEGLPEVKEFISGTQHAVADTKYTEGLLGRRRWFWDIMDWNDQVAHQKAAERKKRNLCWCNACKLSRDGDRAAVNHKIQGCLPAKTRIQTAEGLIPIGEAPLSGDVWTGERWAPYQLLDRGECELATIELSNGQILTCDTRHEVKVSRSKSYEFVGWADLQPGDDVCLTLASPAAFGETMPADHAYWLGFCIGNGSSCGEKGHPNAMTVTFGDRYARYRKEEKALEFKEFLTSVGLGHQNPQVAENKISITTEGAETRSWFENYLYPWGADSHSKTIPGVIWSVHCQARAAFIIGLLDADGYCADKTSPNLHMCQRELLAEVQLLARSVGVSSKLRGPYGPTGSFRLDINKRQAFLVLICGPGSYRPLQCTAPQHAVDTFLRGLESVSTIPTRGSDAVIISRLRHGGPTTVYTLRELCETYNVVCELYETAEVVSTRALGAVETTYTLSVDDPRHQFDSEGVISKNTAADITMLAMIKCHQDVRLQELDVKMLLQVHDELVFEIPEENVEEALPIIQYHMEHPGLELKVPLRAPPSIGNNWEAAKG